jgi:hypothetical protein
MGEKLKVVEIGPDGERKVSEWEMPPDLVARLAAARAEWRRLEEEGTPYWCIHKGRQVDDPAAYWRDDDPEDPIHRKHGVFCRDCGGYIQEG